MDEFPLATSRFRGDPYRFYREARERTPLLHGRTAVGEFFLLFRYEDVVAVLRHPGASVDRAFQPKPVPFDPAEDPASLHPLARAMRVFSRVMLFRDPPDHTRLRGLVAKAFTPRRVEALRPRIGALVAELLDAKAGQGGMDVIADLAAPLPLLVIAELLGVPTDDHRSLKRWTGDLAIMLDGTVAMQFLPRAIGAAVQMIGFLREVVTARREEPRDDLISDLLAVQEEEGGLTEDEILATILVLFGAGHETTTNLIGNGVLALLRHPEERARLAADPGLLPSAVEELLRWDSPVQATSRTLPEPFLAHGVEVPRGREIGLLLGAANHDPAQFEAPDRLDLGRADNRHLSFGHGVHFCLGAPLARLEGQVVLGALLERFPRLALAPGELVWRPGFLFRGVEALPVGFG